MFEAVFYFCLGRPSPGAQWVPGEGPDGHCPSKIRGLGQIPAWIRGCSILVVVISALSTAGSGPKNLERLFACAGVGPLETSG